MGKKRTDFKKTLALLKFHIAIYIEIKIANREITAGSPAGCSLTISVLQMVFPQSEKRAGHDDG